VAAGGRNQALAVISGAFGMVGMLGYAYDVESLYRFAATPAWDAHGSGICRYWRPDCFLPGPTAWARVLIASGPGTQLARWLLPVAVLLPVVPSLAAEAGEKAGLFTPPVGAGLFRAVDGDSLVAVIVWIALASTAPMPRAGKRRGTFATKAN